MTSAGLKVTARSLQVLREAGLNGGFADGMRTAKLVRSSGGFAGVIEAAAARDANAIAITDERGDLPFAEVNGRVNALTRAWSARGIGPGDVIAMLCRDHRGLVTVLAAANKVGAQLLLMNTGFAKPQLADVAKREKVSVLVYDQEFTGLVDGIDEGVTRFVAEGSLQELIRSTSTAPVPPPVKPAA